MEEKKAFGWAFIGTGTLAKQVAKEITASGRHRIAAVYTRNPEKCRAFAEEYGAVAAGSAKEAILAEGVDGVYVVTPHTSHLEYLRMKGTKAKLFLPFYHGANAVTLKRKGAAAERFAGYGGYLNEFDLAAGEIREGLSESRYVPHKATLEVMEILDECRRQMGLVYPFD